MQNPAEEINTVVTLLTAAQAPDVQQAAVRRFLTPDASFRHPLCTISAAPGSRESVLGIYQWYRVMSPHIDIAVKNVVYDEDANILLIDAVQTFHIRFSPLNPAPARILVRITLREIDGLHYIASQEDFYHPEDLAALVLPPLVPALRMALIAAGWVSGFAAKAAQVIGVWRADTTSPETLEGIGLDSGK